MLKQVIDDSLAQMRLSAALSPAPTLAEASAEASKAYNVGATFDTQRFCDARAPGPLEAEIIDLIVNHERAECLREVVVKVTTLLRVKYGEHL